MNNTQLLIDAATAAGIAHDGAVDAGLVLLDENRNFIRYWNSIIDDADAFRLMVDCQVYFISGSTTVLGYVQSKKVIQCMEYYADHNNDKHAATRMAIVRAAAQSQENAECTD